MRKTPRTYVPLIFLNKAYLFYSISRALALWFSTWGLLFSPSDWKLQFLWKTAIFMISIWMLLADSYKFTRRHHYSRTTDLQLYLIPKETTKYISNKLKALKKSHIKLNYEKSYSIYLGIPIFFFTSTFQKMNLINYCN